MVAAGLVARAMTVHDVGVGVNATFHGALRPVGLDGAAYPRLACLMVEVRKDLYMDGERSDRPHVRNVDVDRLAGVLEEGVRCWLDA